MKVIFSYAQLSVGIFLLTMMSQVAKADYVTEVQSDNPLGYWRFEETSGTTAFDSSGNGKTGTYQLGATFGSTGLATTGNAASFDGTTGYIDLPGTWGGVGMTELTIEALVKTTSNTGSFEAIVAGDVTAFAHFQLFEGGIGSTGPYTNVGLVGITAPNVTPLDQWRHVVLTSKSGETKLYVDGVQFGATNTTAFANISASSNVEIGRGHLDTRWFSGLIDEVAIYGTALPEARVQAHFAETGISGPPPPPPPPAASLVAHWTFDNDGTDETGNHNGTLTAGATIDTTAPKVGGGALDLRAVNGYVDIPSTVLNQETSASFSFFVSADSLTHGCCQGIITNNGWDPGKFHVNYNTPGQDVALAVNSLSTWGSTGGLAPDGNWVHVAFTYDSATGKTTPYVNGVAQAPVVGNIGRTIGDGPSHIGSWDLSRYLDGRIDDLRIYTGVLTPGQVASLAAVPEPSSILLITLGMICSFVTYRRSKRYSK